MDVISSTKPSADMHANNFKGKLFGYAQANGFDHPNYIFKKEGFPHSPAFRATVHVAGHTFTASETFARRKDAENFVSKLAFESLSHQASPTAVSPSFLKGSTLCKTLLHEYCVKKGNMVLPTYDTKVPDSGPSTVFFSEVVYGDNKFAGPISKSKKEAEQNAAFDIITSLFENSETRCLISEVIQNAASTKAGSAEVAEKNPPVSPSWIVPTKVWKSILKEYSDKKGCKVPPLYNIQTHLNGSLQAYISSISFEGRIYSGPLSKSKKEAEQAAARVAIDYILGNPESKILMLQAMQSKIGYVSLISNPSIDSNPNQTNTTLDQMSTNPKDQEVGDAGVTLVESLPLVKCSADITGSVLVKSEEAKVENRQVLISRNARKRARRKERDMEAKKAKLVN